MPPSTGTRTTTAATTLLAHEELAADGDEDGVGIAQPDDVGQDADTHHLVPERLVRVAERLKEIDDCDDASTVSALGRMKLPQMTGQIRDVEQRALELARDEGREEFRIKALVYNLIHHTPPTKVVTAKLDEPLPAAPGPPQPRLGLLLGHASEGAVDGSSDEVCALLSSSLACPRLPR